MTRAAILACPHCGAMLAGVVTLAMHRIGGVDGALECASLTQMVANGLLLTDRGFWIAPLHERTAA